MNLKNEKLEVIECIFTLPACQYSNKKNQTENFSKGYTVKLWRFQIRPILKNLYLWQLIKPGVYIDIRE